MPVEVPEYKVLAEISVPARGAALLVADMIFDFVKPEGKLFVPEAPKTLGPIRRLVNKARAAGVPVIFIQDWHRPDDPEFAIWGPHSIQDTPGTAVVPELDPRPEDLYVRKRTYDAFHGTDLEILLRQKGVKTLIITGTVANICVLYTAASASLRGYEVIVPIDCISPLNPFDYQAALRQISFVHQGKLAKAEAIHFATP